VLKWLCAWLTVKRPPGPVRALYRALSRSAVLKSAAPFLRFRRYRANVLILVISSNGGDAALEGVGEASHTAREECRFASIEGLSSVAIILLSLGTYN
jgi:hypothetical protein